MYKVTGYVDVGDSVDAVFLYFAKDFDKVPHERLLTKLISHCIDRKIASWIRGWFSNREPRVCIGGDSSRWRNVTGGVPQGSVRGPVLFLIYVNDLDNGVRNWMLKCADDTKLFIKINNADDGRLQDDMDRLVRWSEEWQMLFNTGKCKVIHFGRNNLHIKYTMKGTELSVTQHERDLGLDVSSDLKVSSQCQQAYSKANKMLGLASRNI